MNLENLRRFQIAPTTQAYDWKDTVLYALSVGLGSDPFEAGDLRYVYERDLLAVPSMCNTLAHPNFWVNTPELELDWVRLLHAEHAFQIHAPLPAAGRLKGSYRMRSVEDKGADKGAILAYDKFLHDDLTDVHYATVTTSLFLRGDGGAGGFGEPPAAPPPIVDRAPDEIVEVPIPLNAALLYRLNGDLNPLHADPQIALAAGFARPILHGLGSLGMVTRVVLKHLCGNRPAQLGGMSVRFKGPVFPGETLLVELFKGEDSAQFRCRVAEREGVALDRGLVTFRADICCESGDEQPAPGAIAKAQQ